MEILYAGSLMACICPSATVPARPSNTSPGQRAEAASSCYPWESAESIPLAPLSDVHAGGLLLDDMFPVGVTGPAVLGEAKSAPTLGALLSFYAHVCCPCQRRPQYRAINAAPAAYGAAMGDPTVVFDSSALIGSPEQFVSSGAVPDATPRSGRLRTISKQKMSVFAVLSKASHLLMGYGTSLTLLTTLAQHAVKHHMQRPVWYDPHRGHTPPSATAHTKSHTA
ncbi:hypothetical protein P154DRAFT_576271 [Amniculicola lignicola CBS 123094]|uniref:Uncharacterized protein n=1 Tax=Amniculicola lignicola CBS 123094 TaxID=1392246 RepID=A0A6A5WMF8_9PLEO|nr:hypothetical protein P154DRAFT_576271 [Amniculicola lignicola CBS 123094]